jgi:pseudouridine-5'-monophosphatase
MHKQIHHVIFDLDGLLLNTESLHEQVHKTLAARYDKTFDRTIKSKIAGRPTLDSAKILVETLQLPLSPEAYLEQRNAILYPLYAQTQMLPGAVKLTKHLHQHHIPMAIATSSSRPHFAMKTAAYRDWLNQFRVIVLGDDSEIRQGKPAPDIFLLAAERLEAQPSTCLVFEDSLAGVQAAIAAGMSVVAIPDQIDHSLYSNASQVLDSLQQFGPQDWGLPAY